MQPLSPSGKKKPLMIVEIGTAIQKKRKRPSVLPALLDCLIVPPPPRIPPPLEKMALASQIAEIWILYVLGILMIAARIFCRTKMVGYRNYEWDDYLVIGVAVSCGPCLCLKLDF